MSQLDWHSWSLWFQRHGKDMIGGSLSIPVSPKLWDTELLCTEYAWNYWLTQVPVNLSQLTRFPVDSSPRRLSVDRWQNYLARVLFDSSPRRLSVDQRWNYSAQVLVDSSPQRPSVDRRWDYLARVLVICTSTDVETVDSHPSRLSLDLATTNNSRPRRLSSSRYRN